MKTDIFRSLAFRVLAPVLAVTVVIGITVYLFLLRNISDFAEAQIRSSFEEMGRDVYRIFDNSINELTSKGILGDEKRVRIEKARVISKIEEFLKENNLKGIVLEDGRERLNIEAIPPDLYENIKEKIRENTVSRLNYHGITYYVYHNYLDLWDWHIVLIKDASDFSILIKKIILLYVITGSILIMGFLFLIVYLRKTIHEPINAITNSLKKRENINYSGIREFEFLSKEINLIRKDLEEETRHLNYVYNISATKRGDDFFEEVVRAINILFGLNTLIARIQQDGSSGHVLSMYVNGEIKKGFDLHLKGTPCEDVMASQHFVVIKEGASNLYPDANLLQDTNADSYIGFAIFNRKGKPIGIINVFGRKRDFSDSDIKVLQTIGQIVAAEIERIDDEKEKERMQEQLFQAQKMEAIGTLAGGIAHDFNNMLQGILGYASLIKMKLDDTDPMYKPIDVIEKTAMRAAELTQQLLGYARKGKYFVVPLNLNDLVTEVMRIITRTFDRAIEIKTSLSRGLWCVQGDKNQIENVIMNLCINARDAMPAGGRLLIETYNKEVIEGEMPYPWAKPGRYAVIRVTDTGTGMDEEVKRHIFEPFYTTKEVGKGTGMGLAMVYGVVKNHDGFITVDSEVGKGSTFTVYLPAKEVVDVHKTTEERKKPVTGTGTILIVDDEESIRNLLRDALSGLGYNVIEAENGRDAIEVFESNKGRIDLVILDLIMPVMGGEETLKRLKGIIPDVKVLIATGFGVDSSLQETLKDIGISGFINKPFNIAEISESIKSALSS